MKKNNDDYQGEHSRRYFFLQNKNTFLNFQ